MFELSVKLFMNTIFELEVWLFMKVFSELFYFIRKFVPIHYSYKILN